MIAVTDIGTNTIKISFYSISNGDFKHIFSNSTKIGLGSYRKDNKLTQKGIDALCDVLSEYMDMTSLMSCKEKYFLATASLRGLDNLSEVILDVKNRTGVDIEIISGENEAKLGFSALKSSIKNLSDGIFIDMGGGSTEVVSVKDGEAVDRISLPIGALFIFNNFVEGIFPTDSELIKLENYVKQLVSEQLSFFSVDEGLTAYITGGSSKAIGKLVTLISGKPHGNRAEFTRDDFSEIFNKIISQDKEFLHAAISKIPDRFYMIAPALVFLNIIFEKFNISKIITVYSGIRDGFVNEKIINNK